MKDRDELQALQFGKLNAGLRRLAVGNQFYREKFAGAGLKLEPVAHWEQFRQIPFTSKAELLADQAAHPPYGRNLTESFESYVRMHQTSGTGGAPLRWLDTAESWNWLLRCWDEIFAAAEVNSSDRLLFPFSFGPFLGFWAAFDNATRSGKFVVAAGGLSSVARLEQITANRITVVLCTPSYALRLADVAHVEGVDLAASSVRALILAGEPGANVPATRARIESAWGARVFDHSGMTEIGSLGLEYAALPGKLFLLEDHCIAEFIDPRTGVATPEGQIGELILTNLGRWANPLIRYRTGDLVCWRKDVHPSGRPFVYLDGGILSRIDDMFWIRGNNVYPTAIEHIVRQFDGIREFALEVIDQSGEADLVVRIEPKPESAHACDDLIANLATAIQNRLHFRPTIEAVAPGVLPVFEMKARRLTKTSAVHPS